MQIQTLSSLEEYTTSFIWMVFAPLDQTPNWHQTWIGAQEG